LVTLARRVPALALLILLLGGRAGAQTASPEELARRHHERGSTFYNLGQFEEAIAEYRKGYEQKADPVFLYNIGQAYRQLGAHDKALFFYRRYLGTAADAPNRLEVEQWVVELEALVAAEERARTPAPPEPLSSPAAPSLPSAPPAAVVGPDVEAREAPRGALWQRWWFWAGVGGLVAGGIVAALLVSSNKSDRPPGTELGTMRFF
jgi:tetratricopeptide (TPR) repeat protein